MNVLALFPRQLRDHFVTRGAAILVIGLFMLLPVLLTDKLDKELVSTSTSS